LEVFVRESEIPLRKRHDEETTLDLLDLATCRGGAARAETWSEQLASALVSNRAGGANTLRR
jgi:hypothetical protein